MLVQMPQHQNKTPENTSAGPHVSAGPQTLDASSSYDFEMMRVFVYESIVGGGGKRAFDLVVVVLTSPVWMLATLLAVTVLKLRSISRHPVGSTEARVGYGGTPFLCSNLNLTQPSAEIVPLPGCGPDLPPAPAPRPRFTWGRVIERLPELWSVLQGKMSLVGPRPLSVEAFDELGWARKYYASARPGVFSLGDCDENGGSPTLSYKYYTRDWSFALDLRILMCLSKRVGRRAKSDMPGIDVGSDA